MKKNIFPTNYGRRHFTPPSVLREKAVAPTATTTPTPSASAAAGAGGPSALTGDTRPLPVRGRSLRGPPLLAYEMLLHLLQHVVNQHVQGPLIQVDPVRHPLTASSRAPSRSLCSQGVQLYACPAHAGSRSRLQWLLRAPLGPRPPRSLPP